MRWPENYSIEIKHKVYIKISKFYDNVALKYINSYSYEDINKLIKNNIRHIRNINHTKLLSDPILDKWKGLGRVVIGKWNFAIDIQGNKVVVVDACHEQNMTNQISMTEALEEDLQTPPNRITNITFPHTPRNPYFIRATIDGEWCGIRKITEKEYNDVMNREIDPYKIAEKYYAKELAENRFKLDEFINRGPKR